ncbi:sulfurtransferase [Parerythrobacter aestuarii]|uniref:sulfurtransferase n=1 Tax=Parerythrobacter aestuarii TaxID=3020909 RepID=UPI0024DEE82D|nr:sulfurtransferase [Parerythrobacter aestuarii]
MDMLVSTQWLAFELGADDLVVLDASLHLPQTDRNAAEEFAAAHIPGARFLDLASVHQPGSSMPGKIPDAIHLESRLAILGVAPGSRIVLYDDSALRTACRAWFLLKMFGLDDVAVLDGGFTKWREEGRPLETERPPAGKVPGITLLPDTTLLRDKQAMLANCDTGAEQVVDARDAERFTGEAEDLIHNLPGGHIPGARNVCFSDLLREDGTFRPIDEMRWAFEDAGISLDDPIITSCGSGVTASVLVFALHLMGITTVALYDGSWSEWGGDPATPKETGAAR